MLLCKNGSDGNTLSDTCNVFMPAGYSKAFTATQAPSPVIDSVELDPCNPSGVKVFYSKSLKCSTISPDD